MDHEEKQLAKAVTRGLVENFYSVWPYLNSGSLFSRMPARCICDVVGDISFSCSHGSIELGRGIVSFMPLRGKEKKLLSAWAKFLIQEDKFDMLEKLVATGALNTGHEPLNFSMRRSIKDKFLDKKRRQYDPK